MAPRPKRGSRPVAQQLRRLAGVTKSDRRRGTYRGARNLDHCPGRNEVSFDSKKNGGESFTPSIVCGTLVHDARMRARKERVRRKVRGFGLMDGLIAGWIDEWIDKWMDEWIDGWIDR